MELNHVYKYNNNQISFTNNMQLEISLHVFVLYWQTIHDALSNTFLMLIMKNEGAHFQGHPVVETKISFERLILVFGLGLKLEVSKTLQKSFKTCYTHF